MQDLPILEWIKEHAVYHSAMEWDPDKPGFNFEPIKHIPKEHGVYFLVSEEGIEKVGKGEAHHGLKERIGSYRNMNSGLNRPNRSPDLTALLIYNVMENELKGKTLDLYYKVTPALMVEESGMTLKAAWARSLEKELSKKARDEGQPMRLSGKGN